MSRQASLNITLNPRSHFSNNIILKTNRFCNSSYNQTPIQCSLDPSILHKILQQKQREVFKTHHIYIHSLTSAIPITKATGSHTTLLFLDTCQWAANHSHGPDPHCTHSPRTWTDWPFRGHKDHPNGAQMTRVVDTPQAPALDHPEGRTTGHNQLSNSGSQAYNRINYTPYVYQFLHLVGFYEVGGGLVYRGLNDVTL